MPTVPNSLTKTTVPDWLSGQFQYMCQKGGFAGAKKSGNQHYIAHTILHGDLTSFNSK